LLGVIDSGRSPAVRLLEAWEQNPDPRAIVKAAAY
jgi:hypothetical protein